MEENLSKLHVKDSDIEYTSTFRGFYMTWQHSSINAITASSHLITALFKNDYNFTPSALPFLPTKAKLYAELQRVQLNYIIVCLGTKSSKEWKHIFGLGGTMYRRTLERTQHKGPVYACHIKMKNIAKDLDNVDFENHGAAGLIRFSTLMNQTKVSEMLEKTLGLKTYKEQLDHIQPIWDLLLVKDEISVEMACASLKSMVLEYHIQEFENINNIKFK